MIEIYTGGLENIPPLTLDEVLKAIKTPRFTLSHLGVQKRVFHNWRHSGIFPEIDEGSRISTLNFLELMWGKIVIDLREFGLSLEKIKEVKDFLFNPLSGKSEVKLSSKDLGEFALKKVEELNIPEDQKAQFRKMLLTEEGRKFLLSTLHQTAYTLIEILVLNTILLRKNNRIAIFKDGKCIPLLEDYRQLPIPDAKNTLAIFEIEPIISIPISPYIAEFLGEEKNLQVLPDLKIVTIQEYEILEMLVGGKLKSITIEFKDGKAESFDVKSFKTMPEHQFNSLIQSIALKDYQTIQAKTNGNKNVYIERTVKKKIK